MSSKTKEIRKRIQIAEEKKGREDEKTIHKAVHTSIIMAIVGGLIVMIIGELLIGHLLKMLNVPDDVFPYALLYIVLADPAKLPTIAISDALNSCSKIAVAATGRAYIGILFHSEPCSISICAVLGMISLTFYFFKH